MVKTSWSGRVECPRDSGFHPGIYGVDRLGEDIRNVAVAADQVFVEVPARNILRSCFRRPFVERVCVWPPDDSLGRDRKADMMLLRGRGDLAGAAGLLIAEIVGGH